MNNSNLQKTITFFTLLFLLFSCGISEEEKKYTETKYDIQIGQYLKDKDWDTERTESGLYIFIEEEGTGPKPTLNDFLTVKYTALLLNGVVFDDTKGQAVQFPFPLSELVSGWQEGLSYMGIGGKAKFIIPPHLAFGDQVSGPIPANSVITIDIELIDIQTESIQVESPKTLKDCSEVIEKYLTDNGIEGATKTIEGMYIIIEDEGSEEKPTVNNEVTIHYKGYLLDHTVFDQTEGKAATFPLNRLIAGWKIGIPHIGKGGKCKLIIPPHIGYGAKESGPIPANSVLIFDIELEDFK